MMMVSDAVPEVHVDEAEDQPLEETFADSVAGDPLAAGAQPRRTALDAEYTPKSSDVSMWGVLKKNTGKKLSQVSMPVTANEPLSALQRLCEELEYSALLDAAAAAQDPLHRMAYVTAFAVSMYASTFWRIGRKPFNPVLGETYEAVRPDRGFRFVAEQVSHHPPISVCSADSKHWQFSQELHANSYFRGTWIHVIPEGFARVTFSDNGDCFEWSKVATNIEGILSGNRTVDHCGTTIVTNTRTGDQCRLDFTKHSRLKKSKRRDIEARIYKSDPSLNLLVPIKALPEPAYLLQGKWNTEVTITPALTGGKSEVLWTVQAPPDNAPVQYGFTQFARELNECPPEGCQWRATLPPTDSRLRPDQRLLEQGETERAAAEKLRVEELHRTMAAAREASKHEYTPRYFTLRPKRQPAFATHAKPMSPATRRKFVQTARSMHPDDGEEAHDGDDDLLHMPSVDGLQTTEWAYLGKYWSMRAKQQCAPEQPLW